MKGNKRPAGKKRGKVLPISMDAGFFFERAVFSLDRYRYDKALKYFRKAVEYEPGNPVNHCNMAGILSEMGDYEGSNAVLKTVLEEIDPGMTECYFYMANNYANLDLFEAAEEALVTYLEQDESGQFLDEAEEMVDLLQVELERPARLRGIKSRQGVYEHDQARSLLEDGKFTQAVSLLEELVQQQPDFLAARNNLALGYYYLGLFRKALDTVEEVLAQDGSNLHGLCNLAIFYQHAGESEALEELANQLASIIPFHEEHVFKLATTMGILGRHEEAFHHFDRLLKSFSIPKDACLFHYAAVAAYHTGRSRQARKLWSKARGLDPQAGVADFYLNRLIAEREGGPVESLPVNYQYLLPFEEQFKRWELEEEGLPSEVKDNPLIRSSFFWALRHGDARTKLQVIQALGLIADQEVEEALQAFLLEPDEDAYLKEMALFVLRSLGVSKPLPVRSGSTTRMVDPSRASTELPVWRSEWQAVVDLAIEHMKRSFDLQQQHDMETLWVDFITRLYPEAPAITHLEGWAAALEYLTAKMHGRYVTYEQVAKQYNISASTASRYVRRVDEVCGVKEKIEAIFPSVQ